MQAGQNAFERVFGDTRIDAAQGVIAAQLDDHRIGFGRQRPVETGEPARCRVAGNARIDHFDVVTGFHQRRFKLGREPLTGREAEPRR